MVKACLNIKWSLDVEKTNIVHHLINYFKANCYKTNILMHKKSPEVHPEQEETCLPSAWEEKKIRLNLSWVSLTYEVRWQHVYLTWAERVRERYRFFQAQFAFQDEIWLKSFFSHSFLSSLSTKVWMEKKHFEKPKIWKIKY